MRIAAILLLAVFAWSGSALAADQPISGVKLQLRQLASGKQKLVFQSKDPSFLFPALGDADAPTMVGATIELFSPTTPAGAALVAPATGVTPGWTAKDSRVDRFQFKRDKGSMAVTPIKGIVMRDGHTLTVMADATGLMLTGTQGAVAIRIRTGTRRSCALFSGGAVVKDVPGMFLGKNASVVGLTDCASTSLSGQPPACGDHEVNQSGEECDGTCDSDVGSFECAPPGASNECTCCSYGGPFTQVLGCCNPSSILIPTPPLSGGFCIATRCDPPYPCQAGDQCQADHSCCSVVGGNPCIAALPGQMIPWNVCCPGLECSRPTAQGVGCCASTGTTCNGNSECCSDSCTSSVCD